MKAPDIPPPMAELGKEAIENPEGLGAIIAEISAPTVADLEAKRGV